MASMDQFYDRSYFSLSPGDKRRRAPVNRDFLPIQTGSGGSIRSAAAPGDPVSRLPAAKVRTRAVTIVAAPSRLPAIGLFGKGG